MPAGAICPSVVEEDIEQRAMDGETAATVRDEPQLAEFVQES
jgi:hypothetical protein